MDSAGIETATLGGGCFWCLEAVFQQLKGVTSVTSGYAGGTTYDPTYNDVCSGKTGHAEVVQITFDPGEVSFKVLLEVFFSIHDPTTLDRQGADVGSQYRSIILHHSSEQQRIAEDVTWELGESGAYANPIVTSIEPFDVFWPAEKEHHDYYRQNRYQGYCQVIIDPKVENFRKKFSDRIA